ncbi:TPA: hypothetical protein G8O67_004841 [Salmonella enterica]|uniref:Integrase catalytic domain-containing protein n=1 Tax=Salmonella enterica TaxID=28901 RepID=A0A756I4Q8_SALER|nr:hypothetical protein [Salmonella enterica]
MKNVRCRILFNGTEDRLMEEKRYLVVAIMKLCRGLGLRTDEAIHQGMPTVHIVFGNRVTSYLQVHIINRDRGREELIFAIKVWRDEKDSKNGRKKRMFTQLKGYYQGYFTRNVAVKGYSSHSMRYAWAVEAFNYWIASGLSRDESLYLIKQSMGYGNGRGRSLKILVSERIDQQLVDECLISKQVTDGTM